MPETREITVILNGGKRRRVSNIPADAKITFGPVSPGSRDYQGTNALRIYTSKENQLAVFVGVQEFRDLSLTVQEQKSSTKRKEDRTVDSEGSKSSVEIKEELEWETVE